MLLLLVVLLALVLRTWGLGFGLPMAEARPDEITIAFQAMKFGRGDLNPHSFNYPTLFKYLVFGAFGAWFAVGRVIGEFAGQEDFLRSFFDGAVTFRLIMRAISAGMGTVAVALLARAPGRLWGAGLLAVAMLAVRDSHFGVTDTTMVTLCVGAVVAADAARGGSRRALLVAAILAGLATSTKYTAALTCVPLAVAAWSGGGARRVAVAAVAMIGAFLLGSPFVLLDHRTFLQDFQFEMTHMATGQFVDVGNAWVHHLTRSLPYGVGWPILLLGAAGMLRAAVDDPRRALVLYSFPVIYFVAIGRGEVAFYRYILPVVPFLCMAAGALVERLAGRSVPLAGLAGALAAGPTFASSLHVISLMAAGDTRDAMGRWIEANVPSEATIVHAGAYTGAPMLQRNVANQTREYEAKAGRSDVGGFRKPDDMKWYVQTRPMYDVLFVRKAGIDFASQVDVNDLIQDPPTWLMIEDYPLEHYSAVPTEVRALAEGRYDEVHVERATEGPTDGVFDQQDALYLPVAGFSGFTRMGPTLHLYRLRP